MIYPLLEGLGKPQYIYIMIVGSSIEQRKTSANNIQHPSFTIHKLQVDVEYKEIILNYPLVN